MPVKIKMCGMTRPEDAETAVRLGADAVGMILSEGDGQRRFDRYVDRRRAMEIAEAAGDDALKIGVFVNESPDRINSLADQLLLDYVQLYRMDDPEVYKLVNCDIIKAVSVTGPESFQGLDAFRVQALLFDGQGGTGKGFDWTLMAGAPRKLPLFLAGGLNAENVAEAVQKVRPDWVDVSSGIEGDARGIKDAEKMQRFLSAVRNAQ